MKRTTIKLVILIIAAFSIYSCSDSTSPSNENNATNLSGSYMGQAPPGLTPLRFPQEPFLPNGDWFYHGPLTFSPDGNEIFWAKYITSTNVIQLSYAEIEDGYWTQPQTPSFALDSGENNPFFSYANSNKLFFISRNAAEGFYYVTKSNGVWAGRVNINIPIPTGMTFGWQFSLTRDESVYLELGDNSPPKDIYRSQNINGVYQTPVRLSDNVNSSENEMSPFIDPDEDYLIFASNRPGGFGYHDLYISFKLPDNSWGEAMNMGATINTDSEDAMPYITQDGLYFFFTTEKSGDQGYNQYWVDAGFIETLRN